MEVCTLLQNICWCEIGIEVVWCIDDIYINRTLMISSYSQAFQEMDENQDGQITQDEFIEVKNIRKALKKIRD